MNDKCIDPTCENRVRSRGLCDRHYQQARNMVRCGKTTWDELVRDGLARAADSLGRRAETVAQKQLRRRSTAPAKHAARDQPLSPEQMEKAAERLGLPSEWAEIRAGQVELALKRLHFDVARAAIDDAEREAEEVRKHKCDKLATPLAQVFGCDVRLLNRLEALGLLTVGDVLRVSLDWLGSQRQIGETTAAAVAVRLKQFVEGHRCQH